MSKKCKYFIAHKKRSCKFDVKPGFEYCGNHLFEFQKNGENRVPCPVDPKHSVFESQLCKHVQICSGKKQLDQKLNQVYFKKEINSGEGGDDVDLVPKQNGNEDVHLNLAQKRMQYVKLLKEQHFLDLVKKVKEIFSDSSSIAQIQESFLTDDNKLKELQKKEDGSIRPFNLKHAQQHISITKNLQYFGLLDGDTVCVEAGAGRGYLTLALTDFVTPKTCIMIDRRPFRLKADREMRQMNLDFRRLMIDLQDVDFGRIFEDIGQFKKWMVTGKHLCGAALDFTIRGVCQNYQDDKFIGGGIASCCHHMCTWRSYVGKQTMKKWGFTPHDFEVLAWMTGWALCGHDAAPGYAAEEKDEVEDGQTISTNGKLQKGQNPAALFTRNERIQIGCMAKMLIDYGRLKYLEKDGRWKVDIVKYVDPSISGENKLIVFKKSQ